MAIDGAEPVGSMGNDLSLAVLSDQAPPLFSYFKQLFAQVTNPPIDPIREEIVMSLATSLGNERNLFDETPRARAQAAARPADPAQPRARDAAPRRPRRLRGAHDRHHLAGRARAPRGMGEAIERICRQAREAIAEGVNIIILSDRQLGPRRAPIPSLLAVAAVHHHLVLEGTRLRAGIIVESGEPREVHHFATLIGYGASAINPYLLLETLDELVVEGRIARAGARRRRRSPISAEEAAQNLVKAIGKGLLKTISKMGISTIQSYRGAQIFEAVGLERELIDTHFTGTASRIGGVGIDVLATEALERHARAYPGRPATSCCPSAASTPGGATASTTCGTPRRSRSSSTRCARPTATSAPRCRATRRRYDGGARERRLREVPRVRAHGQRGRRAQGDAARPAADRRRTEPRRGRARRRSRSRRSSRRARSSSASAPAR